MILVCFEKTRTIALAADFSLLLYSVPVRSQFPVVISLDPHGRAALSIAIVERLNRPGVLSLSLFLSLSLSLSLLLFFSLSGPLARSLARSIWCAAARRRRRYRPRR